MIIDDDQKKRQISIDFSFFGKKVDISSFFIK